MSDHTDEELIALAKKKCWRVSWPWTGESRIPCYEFRETDIPAFARALRQQDLARMARMREKIEQAISVYGTHHCRAKLTEVLSETSDIQEWMDGQRAPVPEGWQLVPTEATREMRRAFKFEQENPINDRQFANWYAAMLKEAPSARSTKGEG